MDSNTASDDGREFPRARIEVLTICPDPADSAQLRWIMSHTNWRCHCAASVAQGFDLLRTTNVSVMLCATEMGDGTWEDVIRLLRERSNAPTVIVFTERADEALWSDIIRAGAQDVLTKPFDPADLYEVISLAYRARDLRASRSGQLASTSGNET
jgi:DNA-binding response OmpR family regulator